MVRVYLINEFDFEVLTQVKIIVSKLRQGVMCRGDISLVTIRWQASQKLPVADFSAPHECVNFDSLNEWARERRINAMEPGLLVHPTLGMKS
jgi:hypothetical protein